MSPFLLAIAQWAIESGQKAMDKQQGFAQYDPSNSVGAATGAPTAPMGGDPGQVLGGLTNANTGSLIGGAVGAAGSGAGASATEATASPTGLFGNLYQGAKLGLSGSEPEAGASLFQHLGKGLTNEALEAPAPMQPGIPMEAQEMPQRQPMLQQMPQMNPFMQELLYRFL